MVRPPVSAAVVGLVALGSAPGHAAEWRQWLGPDRNGVSAEEGFGDAWAARGLEEVWRRDLGAGYSGLTVAGGRVHTLANRGDAEVVVALDATTGEPVWSQRIDAAYDDGMGYDGPRTTPTLTDRHVVALGARGVLAVLSRDDGTIRWTVDLEARFGGSPPSWGYSGSPLVSDGVVYAAAGGSGGNSLIAFDLDDGTVRWKTGDWGAAYSSPVRATLGGRDQVVFFTASGPVAVTPDTGEVLWTHPWSTSYDVHAATPLVLEGDRVFIASGYSTGSALLQISADQSVNELWRTTQMKNRMSTSVRAGDTLYGFDEGHLSALDLATGEEVWTTGGLGRGSVLGAGARDLIVLGENCRLLLAEATPEAYRPRTDPRKVLPSSQCWTMPTLSDGLLFLRDPQQIVAYRVPAPAEEAPRRKGKGRSGTE